MSGGTEFSGQGLSTCSANFLPNGDQPVLACYRLAHDRDRLASGMGLYSRGIPLGSEPCLRVSFHAAADLNLQFHSLR
jgi:hypothetical protein